MKKTLFNMLVIFMAVTILVPSIIVAFASETEEMDENTAGKVTLAATNVSLTKSTDIQSATIYFYADKNIQIASLSVGVELVDNPNAIQLGTYVVANELQGAVVTANGVSYPGPNGSYVSYDANVGGYCLFSVPVTISANATGTYTIQFTVKGLYDADNAGGYDLTEEIITATITVTEAPAAGDEEEGDNDTSTTDSYDSAVSAETPTVNNDGINKVWVNVTVNGTEPNFNSAEIKLTYDPTLLSFDKGSCLQEAVVTGNQKDQSAEFIEITDNGVETGTVIIRDFGGALKTCESVYQLEFSIVKGGNATVALDSAGFSTAEKAASNDLTVDPVDSENDATEKTEVTINHKVVINEETVEYVAPGGNLTFAIPGYNATMNSYTVTAKEDDNDVAEDRISIDSDGNVTIKNVTGALEVTYSATKNSYEIAWEGATDAIIGDKLTTQEYGTPLTFTVKQGKASTDTEDGYYYTVAVYLTADENHSINYTSSENVDGNTTYTVAADNITGNITVKVTYNEDKADNVIMTIDGDHTEVSINNVQAVSDKVQVVKGESITVTLNKEDGYKYVIKTKIGDTEATEITEGESGYTFVAPQEAFTLIVEKTLDTKSLEVSEYLSLSGQNMWLIKINGLTNTTNKTYTYTIDENNTVDLFWSEQYKAYCYLIISASETADDVKKDLGSFALATDRAAKVIDYSGNVNMTTDGKGNAVIDVNDAQLVWNMYNAQYDNFTDAVTVEKFLRADVETDGVIDVNDAAAVITIIQNAGN